MLCLSGFEQYSRWVPLEHSIRWSPTSYQVNSGKLISSFPHLLSIYKLLTRANTFYTLSHSLKDIQKDVLNQN